MITKAQAAAMTKREHQLAYVADLLVTAFHTSRGIGIIGAGSTEKANANVTAIAAAARIMLADDRGDAGNEAYEMAYAILTGQDFKPESVSLALDDLINSAAEIYRDRIAERSSL